jgi:hypothetical protein
MPKKILVSCLLLAVIMASFSSLAGIGPQDAILLKITTLVTTTSSGPTTVGTSYVTQTVGLPPLYSTTMSFDSVHQGSLCYTEQLAFTARQGQHVTGYLKATQPITFYVLSDEAYGNWKAEGQCSVAQDIIFSQQGSESVTLDVPILQDGKYHFLFVYYSHGVNVLIDFYATTGQSTISTVVTPILGTATQVLVSTSTQTLFSTANGTGTVESQQSFSLGLNNPLILGILAIVVIGAVLAYYMVRRKRPQIEAPRVPEPVALRRTSPKVSEVPKVKEAPPAPRSPPVRGFKHCMHCGATIPAVVMFCTKCGKKQE